MTGFVDTHGGFSGNIRQNAISEILFGLLCGNPITDVFEWLEDTIGWESSFSSDEETLFASLARALPNADFRFDINCYYYDYSGWYHCAGFSNGKLKLTSHEQHYVAEHNEDETDDEDEADDEDESSADETLFEMSGGGCIVGEVLSSFEREIDKEGNFIGNSGYLLQRCIELEKESMSDLLNLIETGTDDPSVLVKLGILYETGLAGVDRNLTAAWDYYLKAAGTGDEDAIGFVKKIFSDDSRKDLHELLARECISRESYPVFFDLAVKEKKVELTAELLEYGASLEK